MEHETFTGTVKRLAAIEAGLLGYAWTTNLATGLPWTSIEIAALEAGYEVKA